jgi:hypothetical protein
MQWIPASALAMLPLAACVAPTLAHARINVGVDEAQQRLFPGQKLTPSPVFLSDAQRDKMRELSSVREPFKSERIWRSSDGGWFIIDEVLGKHEMVKYALAILPNGSIKGIEIMEYVESYGYEVADAAWRVQFVGKTSAAPLKLKHDIQNLSGATLSCKHLTDGVKRLMVMFELALKDTK